MCAYHGFPKPWVRLAIARRACFARRPRPLDIFGLICGRGPTGRSWGASRAAFAALFPGRRVLCQGPSATLQGRPPATLATRDLTRFARVRGVWALSYLRAVAVQAPRAWAFLPQHADSSPLRPSAGVVLASTRCHPAFQAPNVLPAPPFMRCRRGLMAPQQPRHEPGVCTKKRPSA